MSTYYHFPSEAAMPTVERMSHESNPGYAEISFEDLHCFPSPEQILRLSAALDIYIAKWVAVDGTGTLSEYLVPADRFIAPEPDEITAKYRGAV